MLLQPKLILSPYMGICDILIPQDYLFRQVLELVDFTFSYEELSAKYCCNNGRIEK